MYAYDNRYSDANSYRERRSDLMGPPPASAPPPIYGRGGGTAPYRGPAPAPGDRNGYPPFQPPAGRFSIGRDGGGFGGRGRGGAGRGFDGGRGGRSSGYSRGGGRAVPVDESLTKAQKAKKLRAVYEQLSCEGFTKDQIELALSAVKEGATYEAALDWLWLNVPGNELPLKFSSGVSIAANEGGSVGVVLTSRDDWTPSVDTSAKIDEDTPGIAIRTKGQWDDKTLDLCQPSQADWIKRYVQSSMAA